MRICLRLPQLAEHGTVVFVFPRSISNIYSLFRNNESPNVRDDSKKKKKKKNLKTQRHARGSTNPAKTITLRRVSIYERRSPWITWYSYSIARDADITEGFHISGRLTRAFAPFTTRQFCAMGSSVMRIYVAASQLPLVTLLPCSLLFFLYYDPGEAVGT